MNQTTNYYLFICAYLIFFFLCGAQAESVNLKPLDPALLSVEKSCSVLAVVDDSNPLYRRVQVNWNAFISNDGDINLLNVVATSLDAVDGDMVVKIGAIDAGAKAQVEGKYFPSVPSQAIFTNTINIEADGEMQNKLANSATAVCLGFKFTPIIDVVSACKAVVNTENGVVDVTVIVVVTNKGDVNLVNVNIFEDFGTTSIGDDATYHIDELAVGKSQTFVRTLPGAILPAFSVPSNTVQDIMDTNDLNENDRRDRREDRKEGDDKEGEFSAGYRFIINVKAKGESQVIGFGSSSDSDNTICLVIYETLAFDDAHDNRERDLSENDRRENDRRETNHNELDLETFERQHTERTPIAK